MLIFNNRKMNPRQVRRLEEAYEKSIDRQKLYATIKTTIPGYTEAQYDKAIRDVLLLLAKERNVDKAHVHDILYTLVSRCWSDTEFSDLYFCIICRVKEALQPINPKV